MKKILKDTITKIAAKAGYILMPAWRFDNLVFETHLKMLFKHYGVTVVIDVGANRGQYRNFLRECVGFQGVIHSFEPLPWLAASLREQAKQDSLWHIHNLALGSENTNLTLNVMERDSFSSFREPDHSKTTKFTESSKVISTEVVPVQRLDDLVINLDGVCDGFVYLKVDTQGFDLEVLKGATSLISRVKGLQFELATQHIYKDVPHYLDVLKFMDQLGFDISGFFPISLDEHWRAVEFDCVMVPHHRAD